MTYHKHFDHLREIALAGLTLTVCGSVLFMSQQEANASTNENGQEATTVNVNVSPQPAATSAHPTPAVSDNQSKTTTGASNNDQTTQTVLNSQSSNQAAQASTQTHNAAYLYSNNLVQVNNAQTINFPSGYTIANVRNVNGKASAQRFENVAIQGIYQNNYQSDPNAAMEKVDINNLTSDQISQLNSYGLNLVNRARAEFGKVPFTQNNATINATRNMTLQYQDKYESLLLDSWHDTDIITYHSENIAAFQVYDDHIPGLVPAPFATARGVNFANANSIPLYTISNMDDLQAMVYYGIMGMLFNDASDNFDHAKNFLVVNQPITTMALYPSITSTVNLNGRWSNGRTFAFNLKNIDMHYIWTTGNDYNRAHFSNSGTVHSWNTVDNGNYAYLDHAAINNAGVLSVSGWHAANASEGRPFHYLIVLDQNDHEIKRVKITKPVNRPDVRYVHNVYDAQRSGFNQQIDLSSVLANTSLLKVISRYTNDPAGNGNYVDYTFAPITVNQSNNAYLDTVAPTGQNLTISGWHATNQAAGKVYHYIIVVDPSNGNREVGRQLVKNGVDRPDVARVYPDIVNANKAGFSVTLPLSAMNFNHALQVISRYSSDPTGNSNYIDYWFPPFTSGHSANRGSLDNFQIRNNQLLVAGWHANDVTRFEQHHYLILWDSTAGKQVAVKKIPNVSRPDVAKVYPNITNAANSGFNTSFDLTAILIIPEHAYSIISRYSSDNSGNGNGNGQQYTDYTFTPRTFNLSNNAYLDTVAANGRNLTIVGWHATNQAINKVYHYIIVVDPSNGNREIGRRLVKDNAARPDIAQVYPGIVNANKAGFSVTLPLSAMNFNHALQVISRYSSDLTGNSNYVDYWFPPFTSGYFANRGNLDNFQVKGKQLLVAGWHANDVAKFEQHHYLILWDSTVGKQVAVKEIQNASRPDVAKAYPDIINAGNSGFSTSFDLTTTPLISGHAYTIISRYSSDATTNDGSGNGQQFTDYRFASRILQPDDHQ